jgi:hypothetical protein
MTPVVDAHIHCIAGADWFPPAEDELKLVMGGNAARLMALEPLAGSALSANRNNQKNTEARK